MRKESTFSWQFVITAVVVKLVAVTVKCDEIETCFAIEPEYIPISPTGTHPADRAYLRCFEEAYNQAMFLVGIELEESRFLTDDEVERFIASKTQTATFGGGTVTTESTTNFDNGDSETTTESENSVSASTSVDLSDEGGGTASARVSELSPSASGTLTSHVDRGSSVSSGSASSGRVSASAISPGSSPSGTPSSARSSSSSGSVSAGTGPSVRVSSSTSDQGSSSRKSFFSSFFHRFRRGGRRQLRKKKKNKNKTNVGSKGSCRNNCYSEQLYGYCWGCHRQRELVQSDTEKRRRLLLQGEIAAVFGQCLRDTVGALLSIQGLLLSGTQIAIVDCVTEYS